MQQTSILYVHHDSGMSGSTLSLINLIKAIDRSRYTLRVALFSNGPAKIIFESIDIPVDIVPARSFWTFPGPSWRELGYYYNWLALLPDKGWFEYLKRRKPDLIHINDKACLQVGITAHKADIPIVWHLRSSYYPSHSRIQSKISRNIIRKCATTLIAISEDETDGFEYLANLKIIHNSVDFLQVEEAQRKREMIRSEFGLANDEIAVATITSAINKVRGTWDFIHSAGIIHNQLPQKKIKFFIVARIPLRKNEDSRNIKSHRKKTNHPLDQVNSLIVENGLEEYVTLTGYRNDPLAVMAGMDIVVVCNRHGVLGRMPFEAMAVGTPVVTTAGHSGKSSIVSNMENAIVVHPGDPESIANGVVRLIIDTKLRQKLVEQGKINTHLHFDAQKNAKLVEKTYEKIMRAKVDKIVNGQQDI